MNSLEEYDSKKNRYQCLDKVLHSLQTISWESEYFKGKCAFLVQCATTICTTFFPVVGYVKYTYLLRSKTVRETCYGPKKHERSGKLDSPSLSIHFPKRRSSLCPNTKFTLPDQKYQGIYPEKDFWRPISAVVRPSLNWTTFNYFRVKDFHCVRDKARFPSQLFKTPDIKEWLRHSVIPSSRCDEIVSKTGWSQTKKFWTHYNISIKKLTTEYISMGSVSLSTIHVKN